MIGAAPGGPDDAANLLKPALARGELRTVAATTWSEYKKYFERIPRCAPLPVGQGRKPPNPMRTHAARVVPTLEKHHKVRILDEGLLAGVKLSHRYCGSPVAGQGHQRSRHGLRRLRWSNSTPRPLRIHSHPRRSAVQTASWGEAAAGRITRNAGRYCGEKDQDRSVPQRMNGRWEKERDLVTRIGKSLAMEPATRRQRATSGAEAAPAAAGAVVACRPRPIRATPRPACRD